MSNDSTVEDFLRAFIAPPNGSTPRDTRAKLEYWIEAATHPEQHTKDNDTSRYAVAAVRRKARQNARRLAERHPDIAQQLMRERQQSGTA